MPRHRHRTHPVGSLAQRHSLSAATHRISPSPQRCVQEDARTEQGCWVRCVAIVIFCRPLVDPEPTYPRVLHLSEALSREQGSLGSV